MRNQLPIRKVEKKRQEFANTFSHHKRRSGHVLEKKKKKKKTGNKKTQKHKLRRF